MGTDNVAEFIGKCLSVAMNGRSIQTPVSNQKSYAQDYGQRSLSQSCSGYSQPGLRVTTCTSPSMPECQRDAIASEVEKEVQTDQYVVPVEELLLEREKLQTYSKNYSQLNVQYRKANKAVEELVQK